MKHLLAAGLISALSHSASPACAQHFNPCADATAFPALEGSLCAVTQAPLAPGSNAGAGVVRLFVRKFPAPDPERRRGEVWLIAGGPGESGASLYPVLPVMRQAFPDFDLVVPDHRGTGHSSRLCEIEESPESPGGIALAPEEWSSCIATMHANLARTQAFSITNAAHDLATLVNSYRDDGEVCLYAVSYGTQLVLRLMQVAPIAVDGIILDGLVPPEADSQRDLSHRTRVVDAVGRSLLTPAQEESYRQLLAQDKPAWRTAMPQGDLRQFMGALLNFPELRERVPGIVESLSRGDTALLTRSVADLEAQFGKLLAYPQSTPSIPLVALISASENNGRRDLTAEIVAREARDALFTIPLPGLLVNSVAPLYARDQFFGRTPERLPRTLVMQGTLDPNTPYEAAGTHAAILLKAGRVQFTTVVSGAHFLPLVAPECFIRAASVFLEGDELERCDALPARHGVSR